MRTEARIQWWGDDEVNHDVDTFWINDAMKSVVGLFWYNNIRGTGLPMPSLRLFVDEDNGVVVAESDV